MLCTALSQLSAVVLPKLHSQVQAHTAAVNSLLSLRRGVFVSASADQLVVLCRVCFALASPSTVLLQPAFENAFVLHWQSPDGVFSLEIESASLDARTLAEVSPHGAHALGVDMVFSDTGTAVGTGDEYGTSTGLDLSLIHI